MAGPYGRASTENWNSGTCIAWAVCSALLGEHDTNVEGNLGMIFCRKTINYQKNGIPKLQTHFKSRDFESVSPTKEYTNHQDTLRFHRMFKVWLCNPMVKALRGKIQGSAHAP